MSQGKAHRRYLSCGKISIWLLYLPYNENSIAKDHTIAFYRRTAARGMVSNLLRQLLILFDILYGLIPVIPLTLLHFLCL
jgi:hypothetical protein